MSVRSDIQRSIDVKLNVDKQNTSLSKQIEEAKQSELVKNATILGQEANKTVAGFKNLETKISTAGTFEQKGEALVELTEDVSGLVDVMDRTSVELNLSTPSLGALFDSDGAEGSLGNLIDGLESGDSASLLDGLTSSVEAIGGDLAGKIASIITLLTGLGAILDGMNAANLSGSGMDALSKTGETMAGKADGLLGSLDNAAGSLEGLSSAASLKELSGAVNDISGAINEVANQVSAIKNINPVSEFTNNLLQDEGGTLTKLGQTYNDVTSTVNEVKNEVNSVRNQINSTVGEVTGAVNTVRDVTNKAKSFVGDVQTGGGKLQDLSERATNSGSNKVTGLTGAAVLAGTGVKGSGVGGISKKNISTVLQQTQSGAPVDLAKACQTVGGRNVAIDDSIKTILAKQKKFSNTRELIQKTSAEAKAKGIDPKLISNFEKVMGVVEIGLKEIDTSITDQIKVGDQERAVWRESFDVLAYPNDFDIFQKFETGEINAVTQANSITVEKKPVVFQTCDTKEELQADIRLFKRRIDSLIIHSTESFKDQFLTAEMLHEDARARGFDTIQYHYIIRRDGTMQRGIPTTLVSKIDPKAYRNNSINIAMVGGLNVPSGTQAANAYRSGSSFTRSQYTTLDTFLDTFFKGYPGAKVYGYGELVDTTNEPYFNVEQYVKRKFGKIR
jgi:hypothetical protein